MQNIQISDTEKKLDIAYEILCIVAVKFNRSFPHNLLSCKLDAPAPCRLAAPDFGFMCHVLADCLHQHLQVI